MNIRTFALAALGAATLSAGTAPAFAADNQQQTSVAVPMVKARQTLRLIMVGSRLALGSHLHFWAH